MQRERSSKKQLLRDSHACNLKCPYITQEERERAETGEGTIKIYLTRKVHRVQSRDWNPSTRRDYAKRIGSGGRSVKISRPQWLPDHVLHDVSSLMPDVGARDSKVRGKRCCGQRERCARLTA